MLAGNLFVVPFPWLFSGCIESDFVKRLSNSKKPANHEFHNELILATFNICRASYYPVYLLLMIADRKFDGCLALITLWTFYTILRADLYTWHNKNAVLRFGFTNSYISVGCSIKQLIFLFCIHVHKWFYIHHDKALWEFFWQVITR